MSAPTGTPWPLGATWTGGGVNFALYSGAADAVELCLYDDTGAIETARIKLEACTDHVWHGFVAGAGPGLRYGYRVYGPYAPARGLRFNPAKLLLDPYAKAWDRPLIWADPAQGHQVGEIDHEPVFDPHDNGAAMVKGVVPGPDDFDWDGDRPPSVSLADTILYELHVKGFTQTHPDLPAPLRGKFLGLAEPAPIAHLTRLGITSVELMPVMAFVDEPIARQRGLTNYWGYNTLGFFVPDSRYAVEDGSREFKTLVKALHQAGIEVILDVVYNHSGEGDHAGPTLSFRGIDNPGYYRLVAGDPSRYDNPTGTGNALALFRPPVLQLMMDSLRWWVTEYHVDGFRFDLATVLARSELGGFDAAAPFLAAMRQDPVLQRVKLIAEPWDIGPGGWQVGRFPAGWSEWNDRSREDLRHFFLRRNVGPSALADRLAGSSGLFRHDGRAPQASINYIVSHDGFTLADLVTYQVKRNEANGEQNRDGPDGGDNWNAGAEGPSDDPAIIARRSALTRVMLAALMACRGMPMLSMGDELGRSQQGNNNAWCQDTPISWLDWSKADPDLVDFVVRLIALRKSRRALTGTEWLENSDVEWLGSAGGAIAADHWGDPSVRALGMHYRTPLVEDELVVVANSGLDTIDFTLPPGDWRVALDSAGDAPVQPVADRIALQASSLCFLVRASM